MLQRAKVALPCNYLVDYDDIAGIDMDQSPADVAVFPIPFKCRVEYAGAAVTETCAGATTTPVVKFDLRPTAGSDTDRGDGDIANLVLGTTAAGKFMYDKAAIGTMLEPGQEVVVELTVQATGTGAAGHVRPALVVTPRDEMFANLSGATETT